jgi:hypothetical protein
MVPLMAIFGALAWTAAGAWVHQTAQRFGVVDSE